MLVLLRPVASWTVTVAVAKSLPRRRSLRSALLESLTLMTPLVPRSSRSELRPSVWCPCRDTSVTVPVHDPLASPEQLSLTSTRPLRPSLARPELKPAPPNCVPELPEVDGAVLEAPGVEVEPPPGVVPVPARFRALGVGGAACTELSGWRWSDSPLGGTGPCTDPVPCELVGTGLEIEPYVMQLNAGGFGLASKHT